MSIHAYKLIAIELPFSPSFDFNFLKKMDVYSIAHKMNVMLGTVYICLEMASKNEIKMNFFHTSHVIRLNFAMKVADMKNGHFTWQS